MIADERIEELMTDVQDDMESVENFLKERNLPTNHVHEIMPSLYLRMLLDTVGIRKIHWPKG